MYLSRKQVLFWPVIFGERIEPFWVKEGVNIDTGLLFIPGNELTILV